MAHFRDNPQARKLGEAYAQNKGKSVAYLDETYRTPTDKPGENPFYVISAVVVRSEDRVGLAADLSHIVGANYWHTTEELKNEQGRMRVLELCKYLREGTEPCLIACKIESFSAARGTEELRRICLLAMLGALWGGGDEWPPVELMILERRASANLVSADQHTMKMARSNGLVGRSAQLLQVSPSVEPLFWLPDLVSSAVRQKLVHENGTYFDEFADQVRYIHVP